MKTWLFLFLLIPLTLTAQYKNDISVVQFSAKFLCDAEVPLTDLKQIDGAHIHTIYLSEELEFFLEEKITYLPTLVLYHDNKTVLKIESDIKLQLPDNAIESIQKQIDLLIER